MRCLKWPFATDPTEGVLSAPADMSPQVTMAMKSKRMMDLISELISDVATQKEAIGNFTVDAIDKNFLIAAMSQIHN